MIEAPVTGVLLAGGQSRRMGGGDKGLLPLAGQAMLSHVIDRLAPQVGAIVINANGDPSRFQAFGLPVVAIGLIYNIVISVAGALIIILGVYGWVQEPSVADDSDYGPPGDATKELAAVE